jgi:hypothetical protein
MQVVLQIKLPAALTASSTPVSAGAAAAAGAAPEGATVLPAAAGVGDVVQGPLGVPMKVVAAVRVDLKVYRYELSYRNDTKVMLVGLMHVLDGFLRFRMMAQEKVGGRGGVLGSVPQAGTAGHSKGWG